MTAQQLHRVQMARAIVKHSFPVDQTIVIEQAIDMCRVSDVDQVAWELKKVGVRVSTEALLAMALSRAVVRQVAEQFMLQEQLKQAKKAVTRTGDTRAS